MRKNNSYLLLSIIIAAMLLYGLCTYIYYYLQQPFFNFYTLISLIPTLVGLTGITIFLKSGFRKSALFRVFMCHSIFSLPFLVWNYLNYLTEDLNLESLPLITKLTLVAGLLSSLILIACSSILLFKLTKEQKIKISYTGYGSETIAEFMPAPADLRFFNRLVDAVIIIIYALSLSALLRINSIKGDTYLQILAYELPVFFVYYLIFEALFKTTAGKCATNTIIVNESGETPGFLQILGRTFCRLIPFEALSFFNATARGWHDSLSGTYVVKADTAATLTTEDIVLDAELNQQMA